MPPLISALVNKADLNTAEVREGQKAQALTKTLI